MTMNQKGNVLSPREQVCAMICTHLSWPECYSFQLMRRTRRTQDAVGKLTTGSVAWTNRRAPNWAGRKKRHWRRSWRTPVKCHCGETLWMSMASSSWLWLCFAMPTLHNLLLAVLKLYCIGQAKIMACRFTQLDTRCIFIIYICQTSEWFTRWFCDYNFNNLKMKATGISRERISI